MIAYKVFEVDGRGRLSPFSPQRSRLTTCAALTNFFRRAHRPDSTPSVPHIRPVSSAPSLTAGCDVFERIRATCLRWDQSAGTIYPRVLNVRSSSRCERGYQLVGKARE